MSSICRLFLKFYSRKKKKKKRKQQKPKKTTPKATKNPKDLETHHSHCPPVLVINAYSLMISFCCITKDADQYLWWNSFMSALFWIMSQVSLPSNTIKGSVILYLWQTEFVVSSGYVSRLFEVSFFINPLPVFALC